MKLYTRKWQKCPTEMIMLAKLKIVIQCSNSVLICWSKCTCNGGWRICSLEIIHYSEKLRSLSGIPDWDKTPVILECSVAWLLNLKCAVTASPKRSNLMNLRWSKKVGIWKEYVFCYIEKMSSVRLTAYSIVVKTFYINPSYLRTMTATASNYTCS